MKFLLLTIVLLGLVAVLQAQDAPSEDQELQGTWYVKAMVANKSLPEVMKPKKMFPMKLTVLEGGNLEGMGEFWINGQCQKIKIVMQKTDQPGKYTILEGKRAIYMEKLSVEGHYIAYCEDQGSGKSFGMGQLIGRDPEQNPEALEEFKKFTHRKRILQENIFVPEQQERCVPERD